MAKRNLRKQGTQDSLEGKADEVKGRVKDAVGGLTNDPGTQTEGKWDKLKGTAKDEIGKMERDLGRQEHEEDLEEDYEEDRFRTDEDIDRMP